jgi:hypothetical protein
MVAFAARRMLLPRSGSSGILAGKQQHLPVFIASQSPKLAEYLQPDYVIWITKPGSLEGAAAATDRRFHLIHNPNRSAASRSPTVSMSLDTSRFDAPPPPQFNKDIRGGGEPLLPRLGGRLRRWPLKAARVTVGCDEATAFVSQRTQLAFSGTVEKEFIELPIADIYRLFRVDHIQWRIGVIVGPSGSGKSVTLRLLPGLLERPPPDWSGGSVLEVLGTGDEAQRRKRLRAAGLSKEQWERPYATLSAGEQSAARLAHALSPFDDNLPGVVAVDEAFSFHDPESALECVHKLIHYVLHPSRSNTQLVLAGAAIDDRILEVLQPCWIFNPSMEPTASDAVRIFRKARDEPAEQCAQARNRVVSPPPSAQLFRRYEFQGTIRKSKLWKESWDLVKRHHYLSHVFPTNAAKNVYILRCSSTNEVVGLIAYGTHCGARSQKDLRKLMVERRLVVIPSWQGMRIGPTLSETIAAHITADGTMRYSSVTGSAALGAQRSAARHLWKPNPINGKLSSGGAHGAKDKAKYVQYSHEFIGSGGGAGAGGSGSLPAAFRSFVPQPQSAAAAAAGGSRSAPLFSPRPAPPPPAFGGAASGELSRKREREAEFVPHTATQLMRNLSSWPHLAGGGQAAAAAAPAAGSAAADSPAARAGAAAEARAAAALAAAAARCTAAAPPAASPAAPPAAPRAAPPAAPPAAARAAPEAIRIDGGDVEIVEVIVIDDNDPDSVVLVDEDDVPDDDCIVLD